MKEFTLERFERPDKFYLGGGKRLLWTPSFPVYLHRQGFWDYASYYDYRIEPCFTFDVIIEGVHEELVQESRQWYPHKWVCNYRSSRLKVIEEKTLLENDLLGSRVTIENMSDSVLPIVLVVWTAQKNTEDGEKTSIVRESNHSIHFKKRLQGRQGRTTETYAGLALSGASSHNVSFSEFTANLPRWDFTPFNEMIEEGQLIQRIGTEGINDQGLIYMGVSRSLSLVPGEKKALQMGVMVSPSLDSISRELLPELGPNIIERSQRSWNDYFTRLPRFECSDEFLEAYYWYRWYGLKLFTIDVQEDLIFNPAIAEGLDYFRSFITYSAQCHMLETRWMKTPHLAQGSILNFVENQLDNGTFSGHIYVDKKQENGFYHADWGRVMLELNNVQPDKAFVGRTYGPLKRYLEYFDRSRDKQACGLYDVIDQFETGQEFMSRYLAVDEDADRYGWTNSIRLKGVDATVYIYNLKKYLARVARMLGRTEEAQELEQSAMKTKNAVLELMWNDDDGMFYDVDPSNMKQTQIKASTCFYPYMTDMVDSSHIPGLKKHLFNPFEFWTPFPVTTTSVDDPTFSPYAQWKGKRHNCPWNGRVWPMTNSHIVDVLGTCARRFDDDELRQRTVELLTKFVKMMFFEGDVVRPNCFEHYNPYNGKASVYRGVDDYQHSWVVDLYFRYIIGIVFMDDGLVIDPFPFELNYSAHGICVQGKSIDVVWDGNRYSVTVDRQNVVLSSTRQKTVLEGFSNLL